MKSALPDRCMQRILESSHGFSQLVFTVWRSFGELSTIPVEFL